ncbi:hypothetical protein TNCV_1984821 [Trichonephila clavipes]|nr:hypothetical protein TNCV_1984821 [Trichonephila clavipes]
MEDIIEKVSAAPYVTVMDLSKGYFHIPLTPRAQRYAAFVTPFGTHIPKKMMLALDQGSTHFGPPIRKREGEKWTAPDVLKSLEKSKEGRKKKKDRKRQRLVVFGKQKRRDLGVLDRDADDESGTADCTDISCGENDLKKGLPYWLGTETI